MYGSIYDLPDDIGRFDVSIFGSILLHLRDPFRALEGAAQRTDDTIVVVEPLATDLLAIPGAAQWNPTQGANPSGWWCHSPSVIADMVKVLGFVDVTISYHQQLHNTHDRDTPHQFFPLFTVVGRRERVLL